MLAYYFICLVALQQLERIATFCEDRIESHSERMVFITSILPIHDLTG